jgi:hypothetical protein
VGDTSAQSEGHIPITFPVPSSLRHRVEQPFSSVGLSGVHSVCLLAEWARGKNIAAAVAGNEHTALLSRDGSVFVCGYNDSGWVDMCTPHDLVRHTKAVQ